MKERDFKLLSCWSRISADLHCFIAVCRRSPGDSHVLVESIIGFFRLFSSALSCEPLPATCVPGRRSDERLESNLAI